jgi:hypothetical protein
MRCENCDTAQAPDNADMLSDRRRVRRAGYMRRKRSAFVRTSSITGVLFVRGVWGSRPPVHPLVALNDFLDLLFCDLLNSVSRLSLASCRIRILAGLTGTQSPSQTDFRPYSDLRLSIAPSPCTGSTVWTD